VPDTLDLDSLGQFGILFLWFTVRQLETFSHFNCLLLDLLVIFFEGKRRTSTTLIWALCGWLFYSVVALQGLEGRAKCRELKTELRNLKRSNKLLKVESFLSVR